ncbi:hypothetical protein E2R51_04060 [Jeotgalibacillus sp. S-D1]|uniref:hypothetical protein n=1 Tax=Jeotgalibacillus sp. S-D1 TaxID=2552189 RepID=UPI00105A5F47|nr:hypothetical protein [Jeotgalibacillus sp. S-D1]TDL34906.1 hypothetical protein E2R51_04060 [Jeotgalibacillus sp. S-D1]
MALKRFALLGLGAAGYAYFKNKDNRDKAMVAFNDSKGKISELAGQAKQSISDYRNKSESKEYNVEDSKMMEEGAQTSVQYFNEKQEDTAENKSL